MKWTSITALLAAICLELAAGKGMAQEPSIGQSFDALSARLEQQDQQIHQLQAQVSSMQQRADITPIAFAPPGSTMATAAPAAPQDYDVGSDMSIKAKFKDGLFLYMETPKKDFTMHLGGWIQYDSVWWGESLDLKAPKGALAGPAQGVASGAAAGGVGDLQDGMYFRRVRIFAEGNFWENGEYRLITMLDNIQYGVVGLDEVWAGAKDVPLIGTVRLGHVKRPMGLEGDMTSSSRTMTFMERSSYSEAIEMNQTFVTGLWLGNNYLDQRLTWSAAAFRNDQLNSGANFGDNQYGLQGRITGLPLYEDEGRHLLHLGVSCGWRSGLSNNNANPWNAAELSARPELRDSDASGDTGSAQAILNANSNAMVDTGNIACGNDMLLGLELLYIRDRWSLQAEYGWNRLNNAVGILNPASSTVPISFNPAFPTGENYTFSGGYIQLACTLTGENRGYDKRFGILSREYFGAKGPYERAYLVRDAEGNICSGLGAWEVAARFSYVDLNSGSGTTAIQGGIMDGVTVGLNWYLNTNMSLMFDYVYDYRYDVPINTAVGATQGVGCRMQFTY